MYFLTDDNYERVDRDWLYNNIGQESIFLQYLGIEPKLNDKFHNPLRYDEFPDCWFYYNPSGKLIFYDPAYKLLFDCFDIVKYKHNLGFFQACLKIAIDFGVISSNNANIKEKDYKILQQAKVQSNRKLEIRVKRRAWTPRDLAYWAKYGIGIEQLDKFRVSPASQLWYDINGELRSFYYYKEKDNDPAYIYYFPFYGEYKYKIYFPFRKKGDQKNPRFVQNVNSCLQGYDLLPLEGAEVCITKSYKDVIAMDSYDIPSFALNNEGAHLPEEVISDLYNRFDNVFILYDNDWAGKKNMVRQLIKYPEILKPLLFAPTNKKDFTDNRAFYGDEWMREKIDLVRNLYL